MVRAHELARRTGAADSRQEATGLADTALAFVVAGEFKVLALLLGDTLEEIRYQ